MAHKNERRSNTRYCIELPVKLVLKKKKGQVVIENLKTDNISSGGALIKTSRNIPENTDIDLTLELSLDRLKLIDAETVSINITGHVIRKEESKTALAFKNNYQVKKNDVPVRNSDLPFTTRENQILELICTGYSNKEIALALDIGLSTVKAHIYNLYKKMGVSNRFQALLWRSALESEK